MLIGTPADLIRIGQAAFGGQSPHPGGYPAIPVVDLDSYALGALAAAGYPEYGSPGWDALQHQFLEELTAAAERGGSWAFVGAFCVGINFVETSHGQDPRFLAILDRALDVLRLDGVSYTAVPPFAMARWEAVHGVDGAHPKGWPSALEYLAAPDPNITPASDDLADGEARRVAQAPAAPENMIYAERRPDGSIQAVVEGPDPDTGQSRRWDWDGLNAADYPSFLRELANRLVTHTYWAHDDLIPYFPCRQRSRDQMRIEARAAQE